MNWERFHAPKRGAGVTQQVDYASSSNARGVMRQFAEKIAKTAQYWGIVTKVIHAGNPHPLTTL
jgi:hypothetical protein